MKIYTIVGGVNGVGKSSFIGMLGACSTDLGVIIDSNKIPADVAVTKIRDCLDRGVSFTQ